jgi:hypothetical protein
MRGLTEIGADGAFVGLPLWQTPTLENSVKFFTDLSEAVPDMPVMIYSNSMFFKSTFPTPFWQGVAQKAPTVITTNVTYGIGTLLDDIRVAGDRINFMPGQNNIYVAYKAPSQRHRRLVHFRGDGARAGGRADERDCSRRRKKSRSDLGGHAHGAALHACGAGRRVSQVQRTIGEMAL